MHIMEIESIGNLLGGISNERTKISENNEYEVIKNYKKYEVKRNKEIVEYLVKNKEELEIALNAIESSTFVEHNDKAMIERLTQSLAFDVPWKNVLSRFVELGERSPKLLMLMVAIATYKFYK